MKAETIQNTVATWEKEPEKAKGKPSVTARSEGARAAMESGSFKWHADLPPALGGTNEAPSPTALLLSALAGCAVVFIRDTLAPQLGIAVESVEAVARCDSDARGLLGIGGVAPDLTGFQLQVSIQSSDGETAVQKLAAVWKERCPIYLALTKPVGVATEFKLA